MCVWAELHWQQPLCISTQRFLSPAVEDMQAGCSSVPQCRHRYVHRDHITLHINPSPLSAITDTFNLHIKKCGSKNQPQIWFVTFVIFAWQTPSATISSRYDHFRSMLNFLSNVLFYWNILWILMMLQIWERTIFQLMYANLHPMCHQGFMYR